MFFRLAVLVLTASVMSSCVRTREPVNETPIRLGSNEAKCLSKSGETLRQYANGKATEEQLRDMWDCISLSLRIFQKRFKPVRPEYYSPQEFQNFFNFYFLKDNPLSDDLLYEMMALKVTLVGGTTNRIYAHEMTYLRNLINVFSLVSSRLRRYMPYTPERIMQLSEAELDASVDSLIWSAKVLGQSLEETGQQYSLNHLSELLRLVMGQLGSDSKTEKILRIAENPKSQLEFLKALKQAFFPNYPDRVSGDEWVSVLVTAARSYAQFLRFQHLNTNYQSWSYGNGFYRFHGFLVDVSALLQEAINRNKDNTIQFESLYALIDHAPDALITADRQVLKEFLNPLIRKFLKQGESRHGLSDIALQELNRNVEDWYQGQLYLFNFWQMLEKKFPDSVKLGFLKENLLSISVDEVLGVWPSLVRSSADRIFSLYKQNSYVPMFYGDDSEISVLSDADPRSSRFSLNDLSRANALSVLTRIFFASHAEGERANLAQLRQFYADTKDIGIEFRFYDPDSKNPADKRFREANLFTQSGNGDEWMNEIESVQLVSYLMSARVSSVRMHKYIVEECEKVGRTSVEENRYHFKFVRGDCFRDKLFGGFSTHFGKLPLLVQFYEKLKKSAPEAKIKEFELSMEQAIGKEIPPNPSSAADEWISSQVSELMFGAAQYVEAIYRRFDTNHDGFLNRNEAEVAFAEAYKGLMVKILQIELKKEQVDEKDALATFLVFLKQGTKPTWADVAFWKVKERLGRQDFRTDRTTILKIFAEISKIFTK